jgi:hypothetical protein
LYPVSPTAVYVFMSRCLAYFPPKKIERLGLFNLSENEDIAFSTGTALMVSLFSLSHWFCHTIITEFVFFFLLLRYENILRLYREMHFGVLKKLPFGLGVLKKKGWEPLLFTYPNTTVKLSRYRHASYEGGGNTTPTHS